MGRQRIKGRKRNRLKGGFTVIGPGERPPKGRQYMVVDSRGALLAGSKIRGIRHKSLRAVDAV